MKTPDHNFNEKAARPEKEESKALTREQIEQHLEALRKTRSTLKPDHILKPKGFASGHNSEYEKAKAENEKEIKRYEMLLDFKLQQEERKDHTHEKDYDQDRKR